MAVESKKNGLEGKVALITGSTDGIGLGMAHSLAARGCHVILNGSGQRPEKDVDVLLDDFNKKYPGIRVKYLPCDLNDVDKVQAMCKAAIDLFPDGIDVVINNADGRPRFYPIETFPLDEWDKMQTVLLKVPFIIIQNLLPGMKQKGWGRIINLASPGAVRGIVKGASSCSARHGMLGLTKVVALETAGSGVTCNCICPGIVLTGGTMNWLEPAAKADNCSLEVALKKALDAYQPSGQVATVEQMGELAAFLCSEAANQMTGQSLHVDGGWTTR